MAEKKKSQSKGKKALIPDFTVSEWNGLNTYIKDIKELRDGETPDSLNWLTGQFKDHIELRRGYALTGITRLAGSGRVTGLGVGQLENATQVPYYTYGEKILYWTGTDFSEVSTLNMLGVNANGEDVAIMPYQNIAGSFVYLTSPNSSIFKVPTANAASVINLNVLAYKGLAKIDTNRLFLWQRKDEAGVTYPTTLYLGTSDLGFQLSQFTQTKAETVGTGDGVTKTFSHTLSIGIGANNAQKTAFGIQVAGPISAGQSISAITMASQAVVSVSSTAPFTVGKSVIISGVSGMVEINGMIGIVMQVGIGAITLNINSSGFTAYSSAGICYPAEYFFDDQNGNMKSDAGGTGTVNYSTGAMVINFVNAPLLSLTIYTQYFTEDSSVGGITDFSQDNSTIAKGQTFQQMDGGGTLMGVCPFDQVQYCFHILKTWYINLNAQTTVGNSTIAGTNLPYRSNFGIPYWRAAYPTPDGILVLDNSHPAEPKIRFLEISPAVAALITVVPTSISDQLDLSPYGFGLSVTRRWGDYDLVAFENVVNGVIDNVNTLMLVRNIFSGQWDLVDYAVSCLDEFNGMLISGDSLSNNIYTLFSGTDDDQALINNHWTSKQFLIAEGLKKLNRFVIKGLIQSNQKIDISFSYDSGTFIKTFTVNGNGAYVNTGSPTIVGANTVGSKVVGGGSGQGPQIIAYPYEVEFIVGSDKFEYIQAQFQATNIGYCSIDQFTFKDIRWCARRSSPSRMATF